MLVSLLTTRLVTARGEQGTMPGLSLSAASLSVWPHLTSVTCHSHSASRIQTPEIMKTILGELIKLNVLF